MAGTDLFDQFMLLPQFHWRNGQVITFFTSYLYFISMSLLYTATKATTKELIDEILEDIGASKSAHSFSNNNIIENLRSRDDSGYVAQQRPNKIS